ncbi:MAG: hypothetical protein K2X08_04950 [Chlamydiales bacterium]|nr:hypothetical protein [Chlamydiales bacterium]
MIPSLQELGIRTVFSSFTPNDLSEWEKTCLRHSCEAVIFKLEPEVLFFKIDPIKRCSEIYAEAFKKSENNKEFTHRSWSWMISYPRLQTFIQKTISEIQNRYFKGALAASQLDLLSVIGEIKDPNELIDVLIESAPLQVGKEHKISSVDACLAYCVYQGFSEAIPFLLERGANMDVMISTYPHKTFLHWSIVNHGFNRTTIALIEAGANVNVEDALGRSPLELLAAKVPLVAREGPDLYTALDYLIRRGADVSLYGVKALEQAKKNHVFCHKSSSKEQKIQRQKVIELLQNVKM